MDAEQFEREQIAKILSDALKIKPQKLRDASGVRIGYAYEFASGHICAIDDRWRVRSWHTSMLDAVDAVALRCLSAEGVVQR